MAGYDLQKLVGRSINMNHIGKKRKYTVTAAYPYFVIAHHYDHDTGYMAKETFCVGDLVHMGILKSKGRVTDE